MRFIFLTRSIGFLCNNHNANTLIRERIFGKHLSKIIFIIGYIDSMNVIERIEELRNARGWSVNRLADKAGIPQSTLSSALSRDSLTVETLERICEGLGISISAFFMTDEQKEAVSAQEKILLDEFRKLSPEKKKALIALLVN